MNKSFKKFLALALVLVLVVSLAACKKEDPPAPVDKGDENGEEVEAGWKFDRPVEIMIPAGAGGGLDTTIRAFQKYLEPELGTSIVINNRDGNSGLAGYTWSYNSVNDGYAFQLTAPSAIIADAQGKSEFDLMAELLPVSGLLRGDGMFFASTKAPFKTAEEMVEYALANPGKVSIATDSPAGVTGALISEFEANSGIEFKWVVSDSTEANISLVAGEVDLYVGTWSDAGDLVEAGQAIGLINLSNKRSKFHPEITCSGDLGFDASLGFFRMFTALKGTPQEAIDAFEAAVHKAGNEPGWVEWLDQNSMDNNYLYTQEELGDIIKMLNDTGKAILK